MRFNIGSYRSEPVWVSRREMRGIPLPERLAYWLYEAVSLTRCLRERCGGGFRVRVDSQQWTRPMRSERHRLGIRDNEFALVRQVHLFCCERPAVFARTVIPARTLTGREKRLAALGNRPLGAYLFSGRGMTRHAVEFARITGRQSCFAVATRDLTAKPDEIWGRRALFAAGDKPLLVSEIFLPDIMQLD